MDAYRGICVSTIDSLLPFVREHILLLRSNEITHLIANFKAGRYPQAKLIKVPGYQTICNALHVILVFNDGAVEGLITFLDDNLNYDLKVLPPYTQYSDKYDQYSKFFD